MRKFYSRILAVCMAGTMAFTPFTPVGTLIGNNITIEAKAADAVDTSWYDNRTEGQTEFTITTAAQLRGLAELVNKNEDIFSECKIKLGKDIDLNNEQWTPIGNGYEFNGEFDGQGHTIYNLKESEIEDANYIKAGLFGVVKGISVEKEDGTYNITPAVIKNVTIENADIEVTNTKNNVPNTLGGTGALVSYGVNINIENCKVKNAKITANNSSPRAGAMLGNIEAGKITNCQVEKSEVNAGANDRVGLLCGYMQGASSSNKKKEQANAIQNVRVQGSVKGRNSIGGVIGYYKEQYNASESIFSSIWNVIGLKRSGLYVPESYINLFYSNVIAYCESKDWQITRAKYSDYSKLILALTAIGVDARDVMGHNLLAYLSDYENVSRQGNNGTIWALIALNSNPAYEIPEDPSAVQQNSEELLVKKVVGMQCQDGGWTMMGTTGDSDMTGMAMQALASYYNKDGYEDVTAAIDKGLAWIEKNQLSSGGFGTMKTETSESVAQIITALCGVGIDCGEDARFIKNGKWPMTGLFQYYMPEGGFMHVAADAGNNGGGAGGIIDGMATEQGLYATVAYRRFLDGETFLYDMSDVAISAGTKPVVSPTIDTGSNSGGNSSSTTAKKTETKPAASKVKVIKVGLNYSTIYLTKGKSKTLKATVSPSNATKKSVKWSSSNKKIATVNAKGKVTGKKAGTVTITVKATDGSGKKATCKVVVTAPATATTAKKTTTTTAARSQTKRITTPTSGTTNRSVSTGSGTPTASGTTKTLSSGSTSGTGTGSTASKSATGTTAKKKDTAAEATTGSWNFSGEDYVPDTYAADETDAAEADTTAEKDNDTSKIVAGLGIFYIVKRICAIAVVVIIAFILYKKRHRIASALRNFQKGGDKE